MSEQIVYTTWEYHPLYGCFTRLVYLKLGDSLYKLLRREYADKVS